MRITNFQDQGRLIEIKSDSISKLLSAPSGYSKLEVTATLNCNTDNPYTSELTIVPSGNLVPNNWFIDLNKPVQLSNNIYELFVKNIFTGKEYNIITTPIPLGYVNTNCLSTTPCTLQNFSSFFAPLFKSQIDAWFTTRSIASSVVVTFSGNTILVASLPSYFSISTISYNSANQLPYLKTTGGYYNGLVDAVFTDNKGNFIITPDAIYLTPSFFSQTDKLQDGVYKITTKLSYTNGYISETNCSFIDVITKCKVASLLLRLKNEAELKEEEVGTMAHLLHYSLVNGSDCGCYCDEMCTVYNELVSILNTNVTTTDVDCGC